MVTFESARTLFIFSKMQTGHNQLVNTKVCLWEGVGEIQSKEHTKYLNAIRINKLNRSSEQVE